MESEEREKNIVPTDSRSLKRYEENIEIVSTSSADKDEIDPYTYLQIIWKHRKAGLIFLLTIVVMTLLISLFTQPVYQAQSTVEAALEKPKVVTFQDVLEVNTADPDFLQTQMDLIQSRSMAQAVLSRFNLWDNPEFFTSIPSKKRSSITFLLSPVMKVINTVLVQPVQFVFDKFKSKGNKGNKGSSGGEKIDREKIKHDWVIDAFLDRVEPSSSENSRIIAITFRAHSPVFAAKMADAIADTFVKWSVDRKLEATRNAREFLQKQLGEVKSDLEKSELALHKFEVDNNIVSLDSKQNLIYNQLEELDKSVAQATAEKTSKEALYKSVESGNPNEVMEVLNDPLIQQLKGDYNKLLIDYSNLSASFKPDYPPLKQLQAKIDGARARLNEETKRRVAAIKADYQTSAQKEEGLKQRAQEQEKVALSVNEKSIQYRVLDREVQSNKSIYESLLQRFKETDVTGGEKSTAIQVVDHAAIPMQPSEPNLPLNLLLAIVVGLIGAVGIAFALEFFDRTIKTPEEVSERMRLPVLGSILKLPENKYYKNLRAPTERLYLIEPRSPFSESIRTVRASIMLSSQDHSTRSILITSCWPGEGKTTIATNLALSLAYGSNRVLLVDADLRHPTLNKIFNTNRGNLGLSNYLMFGSEISEIIHSTDIPQLFVLPSGSIAPPNPSELIHSREMKELLKRLKSEFDYLVVDSSPAIGFSDSFMLSTITDATVVVAGSGMTMRRDISYIVKQLFNAKARFLGVVINGLESGRDTYYYRRYDQYYRAQNKKVEMRTINPPSQEGFDEKGELKNTSYPNLLISLHRRKKTGILNIDSQPKLKIYFVEGFPVFVEGGESKTLLGNIVLSEGRIKQEDYERVLGNLAQTRKKIGEVLIEMGFISPHELDRFLEFQVKEKLIRGFECTAGTYGFRSVGDFVSNILIYKVSPLYVIYEGVKRFGDAKKIEKKFFTVKELAALSGLNLNERLNKVKRLIEVKEMEKEPFILRGLIITSEADLTEKLTDIGLSSGEFRFLRSLAENRDLEDALSSDRLGREDALKLLYFLNSVGFAEIKLKESESDNKPHSFNMEGLSQES